MRRRGPSVRRREGRPLNTSAAPLARKERRSDRGTARQQLAHHLPPSDRRCVLDRGPDARIGPAATDIAAHRRVDVVIRGFWIARQQGRRRHDLARTGNSRIARLPGRATPPGSSHLPACRRSPRLSRSCARQHRCTAVTHDRIGCRQGAPCSSRTAPRHIRT